MLTKEELINKYIKYIPEINEEIFNKIIDKLESLGFHQDGTDSRKQEYRFFTKGYPNIRIKEKKWRTTKLIEECEEIQALDVLGENCDKFEVGEWYKLDNWVSKFKRLEADYKFWGENINTKTGFIDDEGWLDLKFYKPIKISIEEVQQYLPEGHADKIKKWSVGSYIVPLQNRLLTRSEPLTKGKPYEIIDYTNVPYILDNSNSKINFVDDDNAEEKEGIRWFPTLKEAEAFSKELLETKEDDTCQTCNGLGYIEEESKPLTVNDLVKGEIYSSSVEGHENWNSIFISDGGALIKTQLRFNLKEFETDCDYDSTSFAYKIHKFTFKLATLEEKQWLHVCIAENKFIKKEYALRGYDMNGKTLKSEIDETFEEGTLIKGEFYNLPGYAIFEAGKKGYIGSSGRDWRPNCNNNWEGPENFVPATPLEKKWVITCRKQNKFIEKSKLDNYNDEGNLIEMTKCVITSTQEEWDFCLSKCDQSSRLSKCNNKFKHWSETYPEGIAVCIEDNSYCGIKWFKNNGYQVISFQEFLDLNGYTFEEEAFKFKPGDKIVGVAKSKSIIHSSKHSRFNPLGVPGKYFIPDKVEYNEDDTIKLWSNGSYWECFLKDISLYKEEENMKNRYVKYDETFTEDMFNYMLDWAKKQNFPGKPYTIFDNTFDVFKVKGCFWFNPGIKYCYGVDNNPQDHTEITFKELFPEYKPKEMQLSDLKNPVFNIGDKVRVIADSLKEFNSSWIRGNNTDYKKGYEGLITGIDETKSNYEEVKTWYYLDGSSEAISCNLLELVEPVKKEFDRNWYVKVNNQEEADLVFNWLRAQGERVIDIDGTLKFRVNIDKCVSYWKEEGTWFVNNRPRKNTYEKQLSDILPNYSSESKINRNAYYEVNNQEEYHKILIWLKRIGEPVTSNYLVVMGDWRYIIYTGGRWVLSNNHISRVKEEYYFKNDKPSSINISPPLQVIHYDSIINEKHEVKIINVPKI